MVGDDTSKVAVVGAGRMGAAMVGTLRTKTLLMLVPRRMRLVAVAQAARMANWSPPWPSATQADS